jgi:hypothetical protein
MMKKRYLPLAFLFLLLPALAWAAFDETRWHYYKEIYGSEGLSSFKVDSEMYAALNHNFSDLRLVADGKEELPHKPVLSAGGTKVNMASGQLVNNVHVEGEGSSAVIDLGDDPAPMNRIKIVTGTENYRRNVNVYGSDRLGNWGLIRENAYIYNYSDSLAGLRTHNTLVEFPESVFRYYRLVIKEGEEDKKPVEISSVKVFWNEEKPVEWEEWEPASLEIKDNETNQATYVYIDVGQTGLPISRIDLDIAGANYNRAVMVYAGPGKEQANSLHGTDYLFKYDTPKFRAGKSSIEFSPVRQNYIKLVVKNYDSAPLQINGLKLFSKATRIYFEAEQGKAYRAYFGNSGAYLPQYDLNHFQYLDLDRSAQSALSERKKNDKYLTREDRSGMEQKGSPYLLPIGMGAAVLILGLIIFNFFKKK